VLVFGSTHWFEQFSGVAGAQPLVHWKPAPIAEHCGAVAPHAALQAPHVPGFERSPSHPSVGDALQSAYPGSHDATMHVRPWHPIEPWFDGQGVQRVSPHPYFGSVVETQTPKQVCWPGGQLAGVPPASGPGPSSGPADSGVVGPSGVAASLHPPKHSSTE